MIHVVIEAQTRRHIGNFFSTKLAATRYAKHHNGFVVSIPKDQLSAWHAAYLREHGTYQQQLARTAA